MPKTTGHTPEAAGAEDQNKKQALESRRATLRAAERMHRVIQARSSYMPFVHMMMPDSADPDDLSKSRYQEAEFHTLLANHLEKVARGESPRTIIVMPPGHGKSELAAKKYIPWFVGKDPYRHVMFAGYSDDFAQKTGSSVRETMKSARFKQVFPGCQLSPGSASTSFLRTREGGELFFTGVGGAATGRRAHLLIIDDPIKNREEADNILIRNKLWDWFRDVAMTRLADFTCSVIIIQTRWHEDDLIGRLTDPTNDHYNPEVSKEYEIFELSALAGDDDPIGRKKGEALWPEKFNADYLNRIKRSNPRGFASLFQGRPAPEEGDFFKRDWLKTYLEEDLPEGLRYYCASDHAVSTKQGRDYTCLIPFAVDENSNIYIMKDVWWHRRATNDVVEAMLSLMQKYKPLLWVAENGHISKSIGPFLRKRMEDTRTYCTIQEMTPSKDKMTRAQSIQARMSMGKVWFPRFAPWLSAAEGELLKFPSAKHDDFVDTLAWVGITLGQQHGISMEQEKADKEPPVGTMAWIKHSDDCEKRQRESEYKDGY